MSRINLILIIVVANLLLGMLPTVKLDVTQDKIHSLSKTTEETIKKLDDIINIKVYVTKDLPPQIKPVANNLKTILDEVARINPGRLKINYYDPSKNEAIKTEAEKAGVQPLQFNVLKSDKFEISNGYLGLVMSYGDKREVLPVAGDVGNLEYFLVSSIKKLTQEKQRVVAISESLADGQSQYKIFRKFLGQMYQLEDIDIGSTAPINSEIKTWVILRNTSKLDDGAKDRLKTWVEEGKGLLVLDDRFEVTQNMEAIRSPDTGLEEILKLVGMTIEPKLILDENSSIASFQSGRGNFMTNYLFWPQILGENIDRSLPPLSSISSVGLAWVSPIKIEAGARAILKTSKNSLEESEVNNLSPIGQKLPGGNKQQYVVGAINLDQKRVAVVSDTDWLKDQILQNNQQNLVMALNLVDYLGADESLIQIRSKTVKSYPLGNVPENRKTIIRVANIAGPIVILGIIGLIVFIRRKHEN
ncbi:MAG: GldG family protein [Candidatus Shapirobacteria bacterium]|jgi:ABC-type uncharacterized transport system involved in gliding motility auxiliary subunit